MGEGAGGWGPQHTTDPQDELFDVLDEDGNPTGWTKARRLVHRDGDWHPALHIWVGGVGADGVPFALFQRRSLTKDTWPGALDVAVGGHVRAGETLEDAVREAEEEIGLRLSIADLTRIGRRFSGSVNSGALDREAQDVFAVRSDLPLDAYVLHPEEVDAIVAISIHDARRLFSGSVPSVNALECPRGGAPGQREVRLADAVTVTGTYITDALGALDDVIAGRPVTPFLIRV